MSVIELSLDKVLQGKDLTGDQSREVMSFLMEGKATNAQIGALLTALRLKGETVEEITGFAETMREKAGQFPVISNELLDTCGTGGDGKNTFNISTASAIVASSGGITVAKHGNRAASSKSGSADVLEALGIQIQLDPEQAGACLQEVGMSFLFAQNYHASMRHVAATRKELGFRTVFNLLGPLTNPAGAKFQLLGLFDRTKTELIAHVLKKLGTQKALVVASLDGLDEISISDATKVTELNHGEIRTYEITPEMLGLERHPEGMIRGGDAMQNAEIIRQIIDGKKGAPRDIVLANAGACFYVMNQVDSIREGVTFAAQLIDSGAARKKLNDLIDFTGEMAHVS